MVTQFITRGEGGRSALALKAQHCHLDRSVGPRPNGAPTTATVPT